MIIPSIDLMNGKAVQLRQGKEKVLEFDNPLWFAKKFSLYGEVQVIDLDAAFSNGDNLDVIREICKIAKCKVGGGIRTVEKAKKLIEIGAEKIIIGTKADEQFLSELCEAIGREKIVVALDSKKGNITVNGWTEETNRGAINVAKELENYCSEFLYTCVDKEGLMEGPDFGTSIDIRNAVKNKIVVAGGISCVEDVKEFDELGLDSVVGMALYSGRISAEESFVKCLNFEKGGGLIPTVVKDIDGKVLMLAYSNRKSLKKTLSERRPYYYSRSRKKLWLKGETSGNTQELLDVKVDCDKDSLLFIVKQKGKACCLDRYSCFKETKEFDLSKLYEIIKKRLEGEEGESYTKKLCSDDTLLYRKLIEETGEVVTAKNRDELIWEAADLLYFLLVIMAKNGVTLNDIYKENERRDKETLLNRQKLNKPDKRGTKWKL